MIRAKLLNPHTGSDRVEITFELARHAEAILPSFQIQWDRTNLQPTVIKRASVDFDEPSVRGLKEDRQ